MHPNDNENHEEAAVRVVQETDLTRLSSSRRSRSTSVPFPTPEGPEITIRTFLMRYSKFCICSRTFSISFFICRAFAVIS